VSKSDFWRAFELLSGILPHLDSNRVSEHLPLFEGLCLNGLQSGLGRLILPSLGIFVGLLIVVESVERFQNHFSIILEIVSHLDSLFEESGFHRIFVLIENILYLGNEFGLKEIEITEIISKTIEIASNPNFSVSVRAAAIDVSTRVLKKLPPSMISNIFHLCLEIGADLMSEFESVEECLFEHFEVAAQNFHHSDIYPLIEQEISNAFTSNQIYLQASALLLFKIILNEFEDTAFSKVNELMNCLSSALQSDINLLQIVSLDILASLNNCFPSINKYSIQFLPNVIALIPHKSAEIRSKVFQAANSLFELIDGEIPGLFEVYFPLIKEIHENDIGAYFNLLGLVIDLTEDFDDEKCDEVLKVVSEVMKEGDEESKSAILDVVISLLKKDSDQLIFVIETVFPTLTELWATEKVDCLSQCIVFLGEFVKIERESVIELVEPFFEKMIEMLKSKILIGEIVRSFGEMSRYCGDLGEEIVGKLVPIILENLAEGDEIIDGNCLYSIRRIAGLIESNSATRIFEVIIEKVETSKNIEIIDFGLRAMSKLLSKAIERNEPSILTNSINFIGHILTESIGIFEGVPLIEFPERSKFFRPFCSFVSSFFLIETSISNDLCQFILFWINSNILDLDIAEGIGALSVCIVHGTVSTELHCEILRTVVKIIETAEDSNLLQNLVYLLNVMIQKVPSTITNVISLIPKIESWRITATTIQFGYRDLICNIGSLYLQIAILNEEFPNSLLVFALQSFPPTDLSETVSMCQGILTILNRNPIQEIVLEIIFAISRFLIWEEISRSGISEEIRNEVISIFRRICEENPNFVRQIGEKYANQRGKLRQIDRILKN
jgi:hypothetical protein